MGRYFSSLWCWVWPSDLLQSVECGQKWQYASSKPRPSEESHTLWFLVIHHEKHEADLDLARVWSPVQHSQTQLKSAELQSRCRSVSMKINDFHLSYWDFDIVCSKTWLIHQRSCNSHKFIQLIHINHTALYARRCSKNWRYIKDQNRQKSLHASCTQIVAVVQVWNA